MKHIAIVSPHFVPSNLTGVHRARLLVKHLPEFNWRPTIITVHEKYYEEKLDHELSNLLPKDLEIQKAWAFPTRPFRIVGDIGIRGFWGMYQEIKKLHARDPIDFLYITIPSSYAALLGPIAHRTLGIPYGLDYQDPWVHEWPGSEKWFTKAWLSSKMARLLEPLAIENVSLVTGVADSYFEGVLQRNPFLRGRIVASAIPYGSEKSDHEYARQHPRPTFLFSPDDKKFHMVYAGAMLPKAYSVLEALFGAIKLLVAADSDVASLLRLHFIGTGKSPDDSEGHNIRPIIQKYELENWIEEHPTRISYLDVLNHLSQASAILVMGSSEKHYTPSKVFQAFYSKRPIFALLREESDAVKLLQESQRGSVVTFSDRNPLSADRIAEELQKLMSYQAIFSSRNEQKTEIDLYSARFSVKILAQTLNQVLQLRT